MKNLETPEPRSATTYDPATMYDEAIKHYNDGQYADALRSLDILLRNFPNVAAIYASRAAVLCAMTQFKEALESYDAAIAIDSCNAELQFGRGTVLQSLGRFDEAAASYDVALQIQPSHSRALNNKGIILRDFDRVPDAIRSYDAAIAVAPNCADLYVGKAICKLLLGDFDDGFRLYEWRKQYIKPAGAFLPNVPVWTGDDIGGKSLLVQAEQGLGDTIQFCRFAKSAGTQGVSVILQVQDQLVRMLSSIGPGIEIIGANATTPPCDYQVMLLSLPFIYRIRTDKVPHATRYLAAETSLVRSWRAKIGDSPFRIGIGWQGEGTWDGKEKDCDIGRSFKVAEYYSLSKIPGVRLISLQKNEGAEQLLRLPPGMKVEVLGDFDKGADAFIDTAAIMESLDLIITSDTALAHLAGALGRPVWLVLKCVPDWRWLLRRSDTPWYRSMRLFRQSQRGDWQGVFTQIEAEVRECLLHTKDND